MIQSNSIKNIVLFFSATIFEVIILALIIIYSFNLKLDDIFNDKINQNIKNIYFSIIYICLLFNIYFFSKSSYIRLINEKSKIKNLFTGLVISFIFINFYYLILYLSGFYNLDFKYDNTLFLQISIISLFTAFIEEMIFRDYLFNKINESSSISKSILFGSYIYAQLHFLRFNLSFIQIIIPLLSLFFFGIILSKLYLNKGLFYCIGIHWGFIIFISYINQTHIYKPLNQLLITGGLYPPTGLLACLILFIIANKLKNSLSIN